MTRALLFCSISLTFLVGCGGTVETTGAGGHGGTSAGTTGSSTTTSSASSTSSSSTGGAACPPSCDPGFTCCGGACVNTGNDIHNCGACNAPCLGENPFCGNGTCQDAPCTAVITCKGAQFCCGDVCCPGGTLCCNVPGPGPSSGPKCTAPENGTCPPGCPTCK